MTKKVYAASDIWKKKIENVKFEHTQALDIKRQIFQKGFHVLLQKIFSLFALKNARQDLC